MERPGLVFRDAGSHFFLVSRCLNRRLVRYSNEFVSSAYEFTEKPGLSIDEEKAVSTETASTTVFFNPNKNLSIEQQRQRLPVFQCRTHILYLIERYQTVIIIGETGCGKSTQIPQVNYIKIKIFFLVSVLISIWI